MTCQRLLPTAFCLLVFLTAASASVAQELSGIAHRVENVLRSRCFECHTGSDVESGFRLDVFRDQLLAGGDNDKPAIVPGDPDASYLYRLITSKDDSARMPPDGDRLSKADIAAIRQWIREGAKLQRPFRPKENRLWSFQPIRKPAIHPAGDHFRDARTIVNGIDYFVNRRLRDKGLSFSPEEERFRLIRRLYLVALGLPPTPDEVQQFVNDRRPGAWERLVDRVLSSTAFGERWAQHWLDIIRFGETHGFETNRERPNAWPYRDYVIDAFNSDKPYNEFVREQIAGDQLGAPVATGYIVAGPHDIVKSPDVRLTLMQRQDELADIVNVVGTSFLGMTTGCARCHDHKFDPITQKDFYSLQAIFAGTYHADRVLPLAAEQQEELKILDQRIKVLEQRLEKFIRRERKALIVIDDAPGRTPSADAPVVHLEVPAGEGVNPAGQQRGFRDDPGSESRSPNLSGGKYTWWKNKPGVPVLAYKPHLRGRYRAWISWGTGHNSHTRDAVYEVDLDGRLETADDRKRLAVIDQTCFHDRKPAVSQRALWSGFYNAGTVTLNDRSIIVLSGGKIGTAITGDAIAFQPVAEGTSATLRSPTRPPARPPVSPVRNVELFEPVSARFVRFFITKTNQSQPCIDELEIYSGSRNMALASAGAKATSGGDFVHPLHKLAHINDGQYGNSRSWIAGNVQGWVQIELPKTVRIDRIEWGRDRQGKFSDRVAVEYRIEAAVEPDKGFPLASSADRVPFLQGTQPKSIYDFERFLKADADQGRKWLEQKIQLEGRKQKLSRAAKVYAGSFASPPPTHRLYRGDPFQKREVVAPDTIAALGNLNLPVDSPEARRRLGLANWLTRRDNPLLARVIVNRLWQHDFGRGIVATPNDFGNSGQMPTHPELLDWLASELIESDWSLKHVQRLIFLSHTFRQSSQPRHQGMAIDGACDLLWRFPPRRLEAESIRDSILSVAGTLDHQVGGKGFDGFEVEMENVRHFFPKSTYGPADWRRMVYMTKVRQERDSVFGAFDCPDASQVIDRRSRSTTPLQSLNLLNSSFVLQQAALMARSLESEASRKSVSPVVIAYQRAYSRSASPEEVQSARSFVDKYGLRAFCRAILNSNEFLFIE